ncbi:hypothetical protein PILCRDRAFT_823867, partial [Piloderma croceum F 1598]
MEPSRDKFTTTTINVASTPFQIGMSFDIEHNRGMNQGEAMWKKNLKGAKKRQDHHF